MKFEIEVNGTDEQNNIAKEQLINYIANDELFIKEIQYCNLDINEPDLVRVQIDFRKINP